MTELGTLGGHLNCVRAVFSARTTGGVCDDGAGHPGRTPQLCQSRLLGGQQVRFVMTELGTLGGHLNCVRAVFSADNR